MTAINDPHSGLAADGPDAAERAGGDEPTTPGNLEKVRDILFGSQMREVERRFARLEERMVKEHRDLRDDIKRRLDALEAYTNKEADTLAGQIRQEHTERVEATARVSRDLADTAESFQRRSAALDEQVAKGQREIRQTIQGNRR